MIVKKEKGKSTLVTIGEETKTVKQWAQEKGISSRVINQRINNGWSEEKIFQNVMPMSHHSFNEHYFDIIDNEHKAYWLGFIWSDGYLGYRIRDDGREEYNLKLSLMKNDNQHLEKFNHDLQGNYKIHYYIHSKSSFKSSDPYEARLFITNKYLGTVLRNKYGIVPFREDCTKLINNIPKYLAPHFIRGIVDADGTFSHYIVQDKEYMLNKYTIHICGSASILRYIESNLIDAGLIDDIKRKLQKRHKEEHRDKGCRTLVLSGKNNVMSVLNYLYKDATIYLDRKYEKYIDILNI